VLDPAWPIREADIACCSRKSSKSGTTTSDFYVV
jgi:hypothetical protein